MDKEYFYINENGERIGPLKLEELRYHKVFPDTKVRCEGMSDWRSAAEVSELAFLFTKKEVPPFHQYAPGDAVDSSASLEQTYTQKPDSYLVWSILATVFCCLPFGIAGIVYASRVDSYWVQGYYEAAYKASKKARLYTIISVLCAIIPYVVLFIAFSVGTLLH